MKPKFLITYGATALTMILVDLFWLGVVAKPLYQQSIGHLMAESPTLWAALLFNLLNPMGVVVFAVLPNSVHAAVGSGWLGSLLAGALFGLVAYATYDLTNLATLKGWPLSLTLIDMAWGSVASGAAAAVGKQISDRFTSI